MESAAGIRASRVNSPFAITGVSNSPRMAVMSPKTRPKTPSGAVICTASIGSKRMEPHLVRPSSNATGVATKKSKGWVWMVWWLPPIKVIFASVTSQPYTPCFRFWNTLVLMWF